MTKSVAVKVQQKATCSAVCCGAQIEVGDHALLFGDHIFCAQCAAFVVGPASRASEFWLITARLRERQTHDCEENAVPYTSDGALGHGWECGLCGKFLQAG